MSQVDDGSFAITQRRKSRREEFETQTRAVELARRHLPAGAFVTALENAPRTALAGMLAKQRGTRPGLPDLLIVWRGIIVWIEVKSHRGIASKVQRQVRDELLAAGVNWWWLARSPRACLLALHLSGVPLVKWTPPLRLQAWEGPFQNPHARLPQHPTVARERREARKRSRERKREAAQLAAERDVAAGGDIAA